MNATDRAEVRRTKDIRILLCFCVDSSVSMRKGIEKINREIGMFLDKKKKNSLDVDVCLVTFGNEAKVQCPFDFLRRANVKNWTIDPTETLSRLGAGVMMALDCLKDREEKIAKIGPQSTSTLFIITSGDITDPSCCKNKAIPEVKRLLDAKDFKVIVLAADEVIGKNTEILQKFMRDGDKVESISGLGDKDIYNVFSRGLTDESIQHHVLGD